MNPGSQSGRVLGRFEGEADTYARRYTTSSPEVHSFQSRKDKVLKLMRKVQSGKILDLGCGPGLLAEELTARGFDFFGVDIARNMINEATRRCAENPRAHFAIGSADSLPYKDKSFDGLVCMGVVEYLDDDHAVVREIARVLKPNGVAVVTLPNYYAPTRAWRRAFSRYGVQPLKKILRKPHTPGVEHREYREEEYGQLLASHGLKAVDTVYYNFKLSLWPFDEWAPRITTSVARRLEFLGRSSVRWLGTGLIVQAVKL